MKTTAVYPISPDISLSDFRQVLQEKETQGGPILAVSPYQQMNTWVTYRRDTPPDKPLLINVIDPSKPPDEVADHELVCVGDCYLGGVAKRVAVYRQK